MDNKLKIRSSIFHVINTVARAKENTNWSDSISRKKVTDTLDELLNRIKENVDFSQAGQEELELLGFKSYKLYDGTVIMLIPSYVLPLIPDGTVLKPIMGSEKVLGVDYIDDDVRGAHLAYGLCLGKTES